MSFVAHIPDPLIVFDRSYEMRVLNPYPHLGTYGKYVREETYAALKQEMGDRRDRQAILSELYIEAKRVDADILRLTEENRRRVEARLVATECPACGRTQTRAEFSKTQWGRMKAKQAFRCNECCNNN
jgi:hypothetical protein